MLDRLLERIGGTESLPSLPMAAVEVLRLMKSDDVALEELGTVIERDPALTAMLLRRVNSASFGLPRQITSLKRAMAALGLRTVKVMVLGYSLVDALSSHGRDEFDFAAFWRRSLSTAVAARALAHHSLPRLKEEAFVAGLLVDVGVVIAWRQAPEIYRPVAESDACRELRLHEVETRELGVSHATLGHHLLQAWGIPEILCAAVGAHHGENLGALTGESLEMGRIVHAATEIAALFCNDLSTDRMSEVAVRCRELTGVECGDLEEILQSLDPQLQEAAELFSLQLGQTIDYAQLQAEAAMELTRLTAEAEVERADAMRREAQAREELGRLHEEGRAMLRAATTDGLTGLANRAAFDERLAHELAQAKTSAGPLGLMLIDVDYFKQVNDGHGHLVGDQVLRSVAARLHAIVGDAGVVARYGGEEFGVIVPSRSDASLVELAEEIRRSVAQQPIDHAGCSVQVTVSLGVAWVAEWGEPWTSDDLVAEADRLLYLAKRAGRDRVVGAQLAAVPTA